MPTGPRATPPRGRPRGVAANGKTRCGSRVWRIRLLQTACRSSYRLYGCLPACPWLRGDSMPGRLGLLCLGACAAFLSLASAEERPGRLAQDEFFEKSVRPVLAAQCLECHGPRKQKGGLRLD